MKTLSKAVGATLAAALVLTLAPVPAAASDHADPVGLSKLEAGLTGLFAFPNEAGDKLVLILTTRRSLGPAPYELDLEPYTYTIYLDNDPNLAFADEADKARYGATVKKPDEIAPDIEIAFNLDDEAKLVGSPEIKGFDSPPKVTSWSGVYDDPFIFPRFFGTNVVGMGVEIPFSAFRQGQKNWLIWGTTTKKGLLGQTVQIDHVGRSSRTQLGRFDYLNKRFPITGWFASDPISPTEHIGKINRYHAVLQPLLSLLMHGMSHVPALGSIRDLVNYTIAIRPYDYHPDVMVLSLLYDVGYPNGRKLDDDIVGLACSVGDCILQEVASFETPPRDPDQPNVPREDRGPLFPRPVKNDVNDGVFLDSPPYLLPAQTGEMHVDSGVDKCAIWFWVIVLALLALYVWRKRSTVAKRETPEVRPYRPRRVA